MKMDHPQNIAMFSCILSAFVLPHIQPEGQSFLSIAQKLGWKNMTLVQFNGNAFSQSKWVKTGSQIGIQLNIMRVKHKREYLQETCLGSVPVIFILEEHQHLGKFSKLLSCKRPQPSLMLFHQENSETIYSEFRGFNLSRSFYGLNGGKISLFQTFRDQTLVLEHEIKCNNLSCSLKAFKYDFNGATISCETLNWAPWVIIKNCGVGQICQSSGILHHVMEILAHTYNFTWVVKKSDSWGGSPLEGKSYYDPDAKFGGNFGKAVYDVIDISLATWMDTRDRRDVIDQSFNFYKRPITIYLNKGAQPFDSTMFLRPFTQDSWQLYLVTCICVAMSVFAPSYAFKDWTDSWYSHRVSVLFGWLLFVLTNAYYGGALTMFFSSSPSLPFHSMIEGLQLHPHWKMIINEATTSVIQRKQNPQFPEIKEYWDLINSDKGKDLLVPDYSTALKMLTKPGYFLLDAEHITISKEFNKLKLDFELVSVGKEGYISSGMVFPRHSPMTNIFNEGTAL